MPPTIDPAKRGATLPSDPHEGPVTLINSFVVDPRRDEAFEALWTQTSVYFRGQPGFVGLRLHRAVSPDATYRTSMSRSGNLQRSSPRPTRPKNSGKSWPTGLA